MVGDIGHKNSSCANWFISAYINNHTQVWGSWYNPSTGSWGYACCHSTIHISYCTGQAGIEAAASTSAKNLLASSSQPAETVPRPTETVEELPKDAEERRRTAKSAFSKERVGEGEVQLDEERLARALKEEKKRKTRGDDDSRSGKRARGDETYEVTEEQLGKRLLNHAFVRGLIPITEAYRMTRNRMEDPMANYVDEEV
jgi:pre-mRNA-processing factor SLU7